MLREGSIRRCKVRRTQLNCPLLHVLPLWWLLFVLLLFVGCVFVFLFLFLCLSWMVAGSNSNRSRQQQEQLVVMGVGVVIVVIDDCYVLRSLTPGE